MRTTALVALVALAALLACAGCGNQEGRDTTKPTTMPTVKVPVGPVPGPGTREEQDVSNPYGDDAGALTAGRRLFVQFNCSGCHGGHGGGGMGPSLRDPDWIYGKADAQIFDSIAWGRANGMPAWRSRLPDAEIWKLVAYIQSLGTKQEPLPPT